VKRKRFQQKIWCRVASVLEAKKSKVEEKDKVNWQEPFRKRSQMWILSSTRKKWRGRGGALLGGEHSGLGGKK